MPTVDSKWLGRFDGSGFRRNVLSNCGGGEVALAVLIHIYHKTFEIHCLNSAPEHGYHRLVNPLGCIVSRCMAEV